MRPKTTLSPEAIEAAAKRAETQPLDADWEGGVWYNEREVGLLETLPIDGRDKHGNATYLTGWFSGSRVPITAQGGNVGVCAAFVDGIPAGDAWVALEEIYDAGDFDDELSEGRGKAVAAAFRAAK